MILQKGITRHYQVRCALNEMIGRGNLKNACLPPETELCKQFNVSLGTVRRAILDLVQQGVLTRIPGKGTFIQNSGVSLKKIAFLSSWSIPAEELTAPVSYGSIMLQSLFNAAGTAGYSLVLHKLDDEHLDQICARHDAEGVIIATPRKSQEKIVEKLLNLPIPSVVIGANLNRPDINYVAADNAGIIKKTVRYLAALGHREIALVAGVPESYDIHDRLETMRELDADNRRCHCYNILLPEDNLPLWTKTIDQTMAAWKTGQKFPSAVITGGFPIAKAIFTNARKYGIKIPGNLSVIGFDDCLLADYFNPPLTTIGQPLAEIAETAVRFLAHKMETPGGKAAAIQKLLPAQLVLRASCGRYPEGS